MVLSRLEHTLSKELNIRQKNDNNQISIVIIKQDTHAHILPIIITNENMFKNRQNLILFKKKKENYHHFFGSMIIKSSSTSLNDQNNTCHLIIFPNKQFYNNKSSNGTYPLHINIIIFSFLFFGDILFSFSTSYPFFLLGQFLYLSHTLTHHYDISS